VAAASKQAFRKRGLYVSRQNGVPTSVKKSSKFAAPNAAVRDIATAADIELTREQASLEFSREDYTCSVRMASE
jgi:hypothetical protein